MFKSGWVPDYIPKTAKRIEIINGASYSAACVKFNIPVSNSDGFITTLKEKGFNQVNDFYDHPPKFGYFYNRCPFDSNDITKSDSVIYNAETETVSVTNYVIARHNTYFALDKSTGIVYYWLVAKRRKQKNL